MGPRNSRTRTRAAESGCHLVDTPRRGLIGWRSVRRSIRRSPRPNTKQLDAALRSLAIAASAIATYCDHSEHGQHADRSHVVEAAEVLRRTSQQLAHLFHEDAVDLYGRRLARIESESALSRPPGLDVRRAVESARTWDELQAVQERHDRHFHPDVFGLQRIQQLRHCAFHAAKFPGSLAILIAKGGSWGSFIDSRIPDMLLFGLKLSTIMDQRLPRNVIPRND
jgi:hypothetical protein